MSFVIDETLKDMVAAALSVLGDQWPTLQDCIERAVNDEKDALLAIATARLAGEIDDEDMQSQLEDEAETLKAALLVCKVQATVTAQEAANAAIKVLHTAIKAALG